eukprot:symbB.v1.2.026289.t1/scaffold2515.1/size77199/1
MQVLQSRPKEEVQDLLQTFPSRCSRQEPALALAQAEERLKGALDALATLKLPSSSESALRASPQESCFETPRRRLDSVNHTPGSAVLTPITKKPAWRAEPEDSTPIKLTHLREDLATTFRALDDLASAADAAAKTWPVCKDLAMSLRSQAISKLVQLQQQKEDGILSHTAVAQVKEDAVQGLELLQSLPKRDSQQELRHVLNTVTALAAASSMSTSNLTCVEVARNMEDTLQGLRSKRNATEIK